MENYVNQTLWGDKWLNLNIDLNPFYKWHRDLNLNCIQRIFVQSHSVLMYTLMHSVEEHSSGSNEQTVTCFPWLFYFRGFIYLKICWTIHGWNYILLNTCFLMFWFPILFCTMQNSNYLWPQVHPQNFSALKNRVVAFGMGLGSSV